MKFLAISTNTGDPTPYLAAESERMAALIKAGLVERILLKADWSGSVLLVDADSRATAQTELDSLPLVVRQLTAFELTQVVEPPAG